MFQVLLKEKTGLPRKEAAVQFGIPFPRGLFFNHKELAVTTENNSVIEANITATTLWPDNSIKWCLVKTSVNLNADAALKLQIEKRPVISDPANCISRYISETDTDIIVKTKNCSFELSKTTFNFLQKVSTDNVNVAERGHCTLNTIQHGCLHPEVSSYHYRTPSSPGCPLLSELTMKGSFRSEQGELIANFETTLSFYTKTDTLKCSFTLHNPKPAKHDSGLWDLGDPNSLFFSAFDLGFTVNDVTMINWRTDRSKAWQSMEQQPLTIYQESSGGTNWNSPNHKNRNNTVPFTLNGFECRQNDSILQSGQRASPGISIKTQTGQLGVFIEKFWQNCPKSITIKNNQLSIGLFPEQFTDEFELQPGEKKTHTFYLDFSKEDGNLENFETPIEITLNPAWIEKTMVFEYLDTDISDDPIQKVIDEGLTGDNNFFNKREVIDEYGWRNFGDLYADHETEGYDGDGIFISHYNNQYDPVYGFLRQFVLTGNPRWFELADDLARHVVDIDIYHSRYDKVEYNGGLFWHTDHYLEAATSTHRSYSKHQKSNAYIDHAGGGGPGGQHCYTTGLLYHYLITGNASSRKSILQLSDWITNVYEGSGTLLDVLLAIKNRHRIDLKNITTGKYPLDRGTANYIQALLDRFSLTQDQTTLHQIEHIIKNTVHPLDDIEARDLENVEICWFYTIFFQSVCRYLQTKEEMSELDDAFYYARDSLLHYADWMVEHEYPYLEKPEILEFPNHTWTAQDLRKVNILLFSSYYSADRTTSYSTKAKELYSYITGTLPSDSSRTYTRILSILMQNHGAVSFFDNPSQNKQFRGTGNYRPIKKHSQLLALWNVTLAVTCAIRSFSFNKELRWLAHRSDAIAKLTRFNP